MDLLEFRPGPSWAILDFFGPFQTVFGSFQTVSNHFSPSWRNSKNLGPYWTTLDKLGPFLIVYRPFSDHLGQFTTISWLYQTTSWLFPNISWLSLIFPDPFLTFADISRRFLTSPDHLGSFLKHLGPFFSFLFFFHLYNNCTFSRVHATLATQDACIVRLSCFKGILHTSRVTQPTSNSEWVGEPDYINKSHFFLSLTFCSSCWLMYGQSPPSMYP